MRILIDGRQLTQLQPSGVGEYTAQLLRALFRLDHENTYTILTTGWLPMPENGLGPLPPTVSVRHVSLPNRLLTLAMAFTGRPYLDTLAGGIFDMAFLPNLAIGRVSPKLPYAVTLHDLSWKLFPQFYGLRMRVWHVLIHPKNLIQKARCVFTPSSHARRDVMRFLQLSADHVRAIPLGVSKEFGAHPQATDHGVRSRHRLPKRFALFAGTHEPRKNIHAVLDALSVYRQETGDDVHLVLCGGRGWNVRDLHDRLRTASFRTWIHDLGYVPAADKPALYRNAAVFVWPSIYEGFGLPVLEAMACGTPVITTHTSSLPELTGTAALQVNPYDAGELKAALREILSSPALAAELKAAGLKRAASFTWDKTAQAVFAQFKSMGRSLA